MAVYKRKDSAYWWIEFSRGGTRYRFSAETTSRKEALKVERDSKRDIEQQLKSGRRTMRLSEVAKAYYDLRRLGHGKDASAKHDAYRVADILRVFGDVDVDTIKTPDVTDWITSMIQKGLKPSTINRRTSILKAMFRVAKDDLHALDVVPRVQSIRETPTEPRFLSDEEIARLIDASPVHLARLLRFLADTGCRTAEATGLTWGDVRLQDETPSVTLRASRTKTSKGRSVPLTRRATEMLREMHQEAQGRDAEGCPPEVGASQDGRVFTWMNDGGAVAPFASPRTTWRRVRDSVGLGDVVLHSFRHAWASKLVRKGVPLTTVQVLGGWSSLSMLRRYVTETTEEFRDAIARLEDD